MTAAKNAITTNSSASLSMAEPSLSRAGDDRRPAGSVDRVDRAGTVKRADPQLADAIAESDADRSMPTRKRVERAVLIARRRVVTHRASRAGRGSSAAPRTNGSARA